jgi:hypothetical protein
MSEYWPPDALANAGEIEFYLLDQGGIYINSQALSIPLYTINH